MRLRVKEVPTGNKGAKVAFAISVAVSQNAEKVT
jgi:hypothetical protein